MPTSPNAPSARRQFHKRAALAGVAIALLCGGIHSSYGQTPAKDQEAKLIAVLKSSAEAHAKADACQQLASIGTADAVPALAALLADEKLAHMARYGLETVPGPAVDVALRDALGKLTGRIEKSRGSRQ